MNFLLNLFLFAVSFVLIWYGAGLIIGSVSKFSGKLKLSPFAFSFVFLGILTSTPEFSVGIQSVLGNDPEIFIGNLLGGIIVLFLVVIPLLAIFGNGINIKNEMDNKNTLLTLGVILVPALFILDKKVTNFEGVIFMVLYIVLLFVVQRKNGIFDKENQRLLDAKAYSYKDVLKIVAGVAVVFIASNLIVNNTIYFAGLLNISPFFIGLLIIALGTDLPELSLALRSVLSGKRDIAMGDYIGAAAVSTFMFGLFTVLNNGEVTTSNNFVVTFAFIFSALALFYFFSRSKNVISRKEGICMLLLYFLFIFTEIIKG